VEIVDIHDEPSVQSARPIDPFDNLDALRIDQSYIEQCVAIKQLTTVPVGKPNNQAFVRTRREPEFRMDFPVIEIKSDRKEFFIVSRDFAPLIPQEVSYRTMVTTMSRQQVLFIWPIRLPSPDGKKNEWFISERIAAEQAMSKWVRVVANMALGANEIYEAAGDLGEPEWPPFSYSEILRVAFKGRPIVDSFDHPAMKLLRGAV